MDIDAMTIAEARAMGARKFDQDRSPHRRMLGKEWEALVPRLDDEVWTFKWGLAKGLFAHHIMRVNTGLCFPVMDARQDVKNAELALWAIEYIEEKHKVKFDKREDSVLYFVTP